jgi:hypothetical protein
MIFGFLVFQHLMSHDHRGTREPIMSSHFYSHADGDCRGCSKIKIKFFLKESTFYYFSSVSLYVFML